MVAAISLEVRTPSEENSSPPSSPPQLSSCLKRTPRSEPLVVSWGRTEEFVVETEYSGCVIHEPSLVASRLRSRDPPPEQADDTHRRRASGGGAYKLRSMPGDAPVYAMQTTRKARKWKERGATKEPPPLPDGWRQEVRIPLSGRKYRVFLGPSPGMYAESVVKAWECHQRCEQHAEEVPQPASAPEVEPRSRKRIRKSCLPCNLGRKRKCTCGRRSRVW
ncbi:hypothetical protein AB1Y20_021095 [Prymnesium parvum]|uniref:AP2/ERF domain-containing protein n=1 Tax=Prymnesium parvum TaxID=97485 RepID=A0AB34JL23_PRYPA|mmetsp:Transcript_5624/g.14363  ORF Transcript_5624/g.14363 Transcript_5624/m.14363 type:complete len:220 (-) Transcript_5624:389-1048(-)